jgi:hypothetical protein
VHSADNSTLSILITAGVMVVMALVGVAMSRSAHGRNVDPSSILERRPPAHSGAQATDAQPFTLSAVERAVVGIHQNGDEVIFRASGNQWGVAIGLSLGAALLAIVVAAFSDGWLWLVPVIGAAGLVTWTALLVRVRVRMTVDGVLIEGRLSRPVLYPWGRIESAQVEVQESSELWLRDVERPTVAQGVISVDGKWLNLPGFRCTMWSPDKLHDPVNNTDLKVGIVVRYRASVVGPWPSINS